ncbi:MAG: Type secretion system protein precursor [Verrucomicrobiota bacterium]|jgi:prepilin-type N-terminal cleavage/methylation domain-containing protein
MNPRRAFTLIELLVVIALIAILLALIDPPLSNSKNKARRAVCLNNLKQISLGLHLYADDEGDKTPKPEGVQTNKALSVVGFKRMVAAYIGAKPDVSPKAKIFHCPSDVFHYWVSNQTIVPVRQALHERAEVDFSSFGFNGGNLNTNLIRLGIDVSQFGIAGRSVASIRNPSRTVMVAELSAFDPFSWHQPRMPLQNGNHQFDGSMNMLGFVDGHVGYTKMYWTDTSKTSRVRLSANYIRPPDGFDYQWGGD